MEILLIDDSSSDAYLLKEVFAAKTEAASIHWVPDGYEALDYLLKIEKYHSVLRPDLILLDLNMPRISGFEVLKRVKETSEIATIPVVIITTSRDPLDHTQCKALGADMCMTKPHALKDYETLVEKVMDWACPRISNPSLMQKSFN
jgi:CheY-like chemotaxis protein